MRKCAIHEALDNFEALKLRGGVIRLDGKVRSFQPLAKKLNDDTSRFACRKGQSGNTRLYAVINRDFAKMRGATLPYLNREEDKWARRAAHGKRIV